MPEPTPQTNPRRRSWVELSVGLAALVVSVASLFVARHQAQVMDRQLAASVWPLLEYTSSNVTLDGTPRIALTLRNTGIGPLRIRSFRATSDGKPVTGLRDVARRCCEADSAALRGLFPVTSYIGGRVVPAGEGFDFVAARYDPALDAPFRRFQTGLYKLRLRYCYCSVLDDCWIRSTENPDADPEPVRSCAEEQKQPQFKL